MNNPRRTRHEREREFQALLGTTEGRRELETLAERYAADSGKPMPHGTSIITYLLIHERTQGLLDP